MVALPEGRKLGAYRIVRLLGQGGMGAVYEARQEPLDRRVAIKTLLSEHANNGEALARFFNEAKVLSRLEHPSLVQVSDFGHSADGTAYLVMEYLRGQSLGHRTRELSTRGDLLPISTTLQFGLQVADVLSVAHEQGIVHRDLKPDNLMLVVDPVAPGGERVKVLDFGIAKLSDERGGIKTATDQVMGTPAYMSPEQCAGAGGVDAKTDVYALGCVLYELLTGWTPFVAEGPGLLIGMHLFQEPPSLLNVAPHVPTEIAGLVQRMLLKDKTQRPTMKVVVTELGTQLSKRMDGVNQPPSQANDAPDVPKTLLKQALPSTIGVSLDERIPRSGKPMGGLSGMYWGTGVLGLGIGVALWVGLRASTRPASVQPESKPSIEVTPVPVHERPTPGNTPTQSAPGSVGVGSTAESVVAASLDNPPVVKPLPSVKSPADHPENGPDRQKTTGAPTSGDTEPGSDAPTASPPKPKKAPVKSKSARVPSARPGTETPEKKRFGYED